MPDPAAVSPASNTPASNTRPPNGDDIAKIKAAHAGKRLKQLSACGYTVVIRPPEDVEWERFQRDALEPDRRVGATERLFRDCCVWPEKPAIDAMLKALPALVETFSSPVTELAGLTKNVEKKDL